MRTILIILVGMVLVGCVSIAPKKVTADVMSSTGPNVFVEMVDVRAERPGVVPDLSSAPLLYRNTEIKFEQDVASYVKETLEGYMVKHGYGISPTNDQADIYIRGRIIRFSPRLGTWDWVGEVDLEISVNQGSPFRTTGSGAITNWGTTNTAEYACEALDQALMECFSQLDYEMVK